MPKPLTQTTGRRKAAIARVSACALGTGPSWSTAGLSRTTFPRLPTGWY